MRKYVTIILVLGMLLTGTINTVLSKLQDLQCVENCSDPDTSKRKYFEQPVWQTLNMFLGEAACLIVFGINAYIANHWKTQQPIDRAVGDSDTTRQSIDSQYLETRPLVDVEDVNPSADHDYIPLTGKKNFLLWIPTLCDMTASTLMNAGLIFVSASVYQMLRGSVVLFTASLSIWFLGKRHPPYKWFALIVVFVGVFFVGLSSIVYPDPIGLNAAKAESDKSMLGVSMVVLAQIFTACQFVIEEKILSKYDVPPLKAVGLEGVFGLTSVLFLLPIGYYTIGIHGKPGNYFDVFTGYSQIISYPQVLYSGVGIIFSISFFNWFGLSVTRHLSATSRSTIDTCRTLFIWLISLSLGWEKFKWLQVIGFSILIYGTFVFNDVIKPPFKNRAHNV